ncbi:hypothetical protein THIOSC15_2300011 [uncultured Thiomicrorhabdus sp.]
MSSGKNSLQLPIIFSSALLIMVSIILFDRNQQQQQIWQQMNGDNRAAEQLIRNQLAALYGDISIISDQPSLLEYAETHNERARQTTEQSFLTIMHNQPEFMQLRY